MNHLPEETRWLFELHLMLKLPDRFHDLFFFVVRKVRVMQAPLKPQKNHLLPVILAGVWFAPHQIP